MRPIPSTLLLPVLAGLALILPNCVYPYYYPYRPASPYYAGRPYPPSPDGGDPYYYQRRGRGTVVDQDDDSSPGATPDRRSRDRERDDDPQIQPSTPPDSGCSPPSGANTGTPPAPSKPSGSNVPTATRTNKAGRVKSPFAPFNELDVAGLPSGSLAKDPATGQVFRVP